MSARRFTILATNVKTTVLYLLVGITFFVGVESCRSGKEGTQGSTKTKKGWLARLFSKKSEKNSATFTSKEVSKVIQTARSYRGTPHKTGGVSRLGIDCSALVQVSFQSAGLQVPRTAAQQSQFGKPIEKNHLRPGDLVFFSDRKIGNGITHVGLVTELLPNGEIKFIHTSSKLGVTENLLSTSYFSKTYAKATRPF